MAHRDMAEIFHDPHKTLRRPSYILKDDPYFRLMSSELASKTERTKNGET